MHLALAALLLAGGLVNPESATVGFDGRIYFSEIGERDKDGDGRIGVLSKGKPVTFAAGLDDPKGIVAFRDGFFVADKTRVWLIDRDGKATVFAAKEAFPTAPLYLNDITVDQVGNLYVSDSGLGEAGQPKVFAISTEGKVSVFADEKRLPELKRTNGVLVSRDNKVVFIADAGTGVLYRASIKDDGVRKVAEGLGAPDGIVEDAAGNLFVSDVRGGKIFRVNPGDPKPILVAEGFQSAADICLSFDGTSVIVPDLRAGKLFEQRIAPMGAVAPIYRRLVNPESVVRAEDGTTYVTVIGEFNKDGDGVVMAYPPRMPAKEFAKGLDDPKGIVLKGGELFVTDKTRVVKIDKSGAVSDFAAASAFPTPPIFLNDITVDEAGVFYVSDSGDSKGTGGAIFQISADGKVTTLVDTQNPLISSPNGLLADGKGSLYIGDFNTGDILKMDLKTKNADKIAGGLKGADGLVLDHDGNLYISQWTTGEVSVLAPGASEAKLISNQFVSAADMFLDERNGRLMTPDMKAGTVTNLPLPVANPKGVDESVMEVRIEQVFGEVMIDRPIVLTHANDGSNRVFIAGQHGKVHVLPNDPAASESKIFLDWEAKTAKYEKANEEGFLGLAFHPKYKENGRFYIFYTPTDEPRRSVISQLTVDPKNADAADATSEKVLLKIPQPFGNHNGGTIAFGPDGFLYIGMGDGGLADDPYGNGQKMDTLLGKILRIDVDRQEDGKAYAIPKDNPFVGKEGARGEIWALGARNIWRHSFDRETGDCWAADVGQNIWEEVNLITRGGNYGWNRRESKHQFKATGSGPKPKFTEPVWEYHHNVGLSITGGNVYRGKRVPELAGHYLYADYVTGRIWALAYDRASKKVTANKPIAGNVSPVMSFGEDQAGEVYFLTVNGGVFRFQSIAPSNK